MFPFPPREEDLSLRSLLASADPFNVTSRIHVSRDTTLEKTKPGQQGWSIDTEKERAQVPLTQLHNIQEWDACGGQGTRTTTPVQRIPVLRLTYKWSNDM